jgi:hypothetical protein
MHDDDPIDFSFAELPTTAPRRSLVPTPRGGERTAPRLCAMCRRFKISDDGDVRTLERRLAAYRGALGDR